MSRLHWFALSTLPGIGGTTARRLLERFGSVEAIFAAPDEALLQTPRINAALVARLRAISLEARQAELTSLADEGIQVVTWSDPDYPASLHAISDAPPLLFVRGSLLTDDTQAVALVGTRKPDAHYVEVTTMLARELARRSLTIVSGLALGIDTAAHQGALQAATGRTLAIPGSGLRALHPRQNQPLAEKIVQQGALLSELHPDTRARGNNLMARDRIVSGLSRAVIVVAAGAQSGSLDTAAKARRQGRLLFAVPGSPGTDALIADGAELLAPETIDLEALAQRIVMHGDRPREGPIQTSFL